MPVYTMQDTETEAVFDVNMKYDELEAFLESNPNLRQIFKFPGVVDPARIGRMKVDSGFRDVLIKAKSAHKHSTIDTR
jgi:hypothetical protein